jgi:serine/threonine-protein kinase
MFSLGVIFYELLAGRRPFEADRESHTAQSIRHAAPEPLGPKRPDVSPELERIVQRCLEKSRERRFDSMGQLIRALEHLLGAQALGELCPMVARALGEAGLAVPSAAPGPRTREGELRRREAGRGLRQSLVMLALVSTFTLSGGAALYSWLDADRAAPNVAPAVLERVGRGELLVIAEPWAHVFVDGEQVETTPFATPLLLTPGVRHVRLEHPSAQPEQRRIEVAAGQRVVLEVEMKVTRDVLDAGADPGPRAPDASRSTP